MIRRSLLYVVPLLLCLLLVACGSPAEPAVPPTVTPAVTPIVQSPTPTPTITATPTAMPPTPMPEPERREPTAQPTPSPTVPEGRRVPCGLADGACLTLVAEPLTEGLVEPVGVEHTGVEEDQRLFVVERKGRIRVVESDGTIKEPPFLDLSDQVETENWEQGLLGLAFHPRYAENGQFYIDYIDLEGNTQVVRYTVSPDDVNVADPDSAFTILSVAQPEPNHNGGALVFGPEGYLYQTLGDGGAGKSWGNAQDGNTLLGSILRLDVDGGTPYAIPPDNPFVGNPDVQDEIWVMGLRNPWRLTFDRRTGDAYLSDVGVDDWEEINHVPAGSSGQNFGWPCLQGPDPQYPEFCTEEDALTPPIHAVSHADDVCSIITGYVYCGAAHPDLQGQLLVSDLCNNGVWALRTDGEPRWAVASVGDADGWWNCFGEDAEGNLFAVALDIGTLFSLETSSVP